MTETHAKPKQQAWKQCAKHSVQVPYFRVLPEYPAAMFLSWDAGDPGCTNAHARLLEKCPSINEKPPRETLSEGLFTVHLMRCS